MEQFFSSDLILVGFSLVLGGLVGMFWERARHDRQGNSSSGDRSGSDKS
ncbi:hypothetical protein [Sandarakinorhabdus oryzae]|nr:hypothetical protein [Sandarakinorhabdus oryzae]